MSKYYNSGDILAQKKPAKATRGNVDESLEKETQEKITNPRAINGGRDRVPENHAEKNKERLNSSLAKTPLHARAEVKEKAQPKKKPLMKMKPIKKAIKKESTQTFPISSIIFITVFTLALIYVIHLYIEIDDLNSSLANLNNEIVEMKREEMALEIEKNSMYPLEEIERIAKEKYGMVNIDQLPKEYITPENKDEIEIIDKGNENETPGALLSGFARVVSDLLSYIN